MECVSVSKGREIRMSCSWGKKFVFQQISVVSFFSLLSRISCVVIFDKNIIISQPGFVRSCVLWCVFLMITWISISRYLLSLTDDFGDPSTVTFEKNTRLRTDKTTWRLLTNDLLSSCLFSVTESIREDKKDTHHDERACPGVSVEGESKGNWCIQSLLLDSSSHTATLGYVCINSGYCRYRVTIVTQIIMLRKHTQMHSLIF